MTVKEGVEVHETSTLIEHCLNYNPSFDRTVRLQLRREDDSGVDDGHYKVGPGEDLSVTN